MKDKYMKRLLNSIYAPPVAVAWNLLLLYIVYQLARLEYYAENASYFTPLMEEGSGDMKVYIWVPLKKA